MLYWDAVANIWSVDGVVYPDEVSARLAQEQKDKIMSFSSMTNISAEQELAQSIPVMLISLRDLYATLLATKETWEVNGITEKIDAATQANETLAGYDPASWALWGTTTNALLAWMNAPMGEGLPSPREVLLRRYVREA